MSKVKTTRVWNGLPVDEYTNTETGVVELYSQPTRGAMGSTTPGTLFATGDDKGKWSYNDQAGFRRGFNNKQRTQGKPTLTQEDFNKKFFTEGTKIFNNDRANVLNTETNYETKELFNSKTSAYSTNGIPGVKNSETGDKNNSNGDSVVDSDNNTDEEEVAGSEQGGNPSDSSSTLGGERDFGSNTNSFRYPIGILPDLDYDFIQFIACEYKAGSFTGGKNGKFQGLTTKGDIEARVGAHAETITLPMIPALSESNVVAWGEDRINPLQVAAANIAGQTLQGQTGGIDLPQAIKDFTAATTAEATRLLNEEGTRQFIVSYFAGLAAGGANVLGRTGSVINPNLELLFTGPSLRSFSFNFKFRPRDPDEAKMVRSIIRVFKRNMAVQRTSGENFLLTPNIFKIKYLHNGEPHPFMNRLMPCACTSFNVVYTPDNNYMTYADGSMTGYDVSFTMAEIVPIYADHQKDAGGTGF
jgi:hypothetical protein